MKLIILIISIVMLVLSLRSKTWKKAMLSTSINSKVNQESDNFEIGDEGSSISRLTPMGKARFGDEFVDHYAVTREWEDEQQRGAITDWQLKRYFEII